MMSYLMKLRFSWADKDLFTSHCLSAFEATQSAILAWILYVRPFVTILILYYVKMAKHHIVIILIFLE